MMKETTKAPKQFAAVAYDPESEEWRSFKVGTKEECNQACDALSALLGEQLGMLEKPLKVVPFKKNVQSCASTPVVMGGANPYGGTQVQCHYQFEADEDYCEEERTYFAPTAESMAKEGEPMLMVIFHGNIPGGWTMVNRELTVAEYWQAC